MSSEVDFFCATLIRFLSLFSGGLEQSEALEGARESTESDNDSSIFPTPLGRENTTIITLNVLAVSAVIY